MESKQNKCGNCNAEFKNEYDKNSSNYLCAGKKICTTCNDKEVILRIANMN